MISYLDEHCSSWLFFWYFFLQFQIGQGRGVRNKEGRWQVKSTPAVSSSVSRGAPVDEVEVVTDGLRGLTVADQTGQADAAVSPKQFGGASLQNQTMVPGQKAVWKPKSYGTLGGATAAPVEQVAAEQKVSQAGLRERSGAGASLDALFRGKLFENFTVDNHTYAHAQIRATFYPKFENEKSDQEVFFLLYIAFEFCVTLLCCYLMHGFFSRCK